MQGNYTREMESVDCERPSRCVWHQDRPGEAKLGWLLHGLHTPQVSQHLQVTGTITCAEAAKRTMIPSTWLSWLQQVALPRTPSLTFSSPRPSTLQETPLVRSSPLLLDAWKMTEASTEAQASVSHHWYFQLLLRPGSGIGSNTWRARPGERSISSNTRRQAAS